MRTSTKSCRTSRESSLSIRTMTLTLHSHKSYKKCRTMRRCWREEMEWSQKQWRRQWLKICQWVCTRWAIQTEEGNVRTMADRTTITLTPLIIISLQEIWQLLKAVKRLQTVNHKVHKILLGTINCKTQLLRDKECLLKKIAKKVRSEASNR